MATLRDWVPKQLIGNEEYRYTVRSLDHFVDESVA